MSEDVKLTDLTENLIELTGMDTSLARLLEEQTDHLGPKDSAKIKACSMQNPHEPEATLPATPSLV